ncbi:hypothetical protein R3P38DRAFT_3337357 [Favolaschia claudopus]|uniref:Uncharacterized protein n=1 Tax=Favolaschia claudopus TaxID=2862362 RepID=A0AAV9Z2A9_9AGAR
MLVMIEQKKKTGKPSDFQGKRLEFLLQFHPTYLDASQRGKTRGIWDEFFKRYWRTFPWRLPLSQDPDESDPTDYALAPQDTQEVDAQSKTISGTEQKIKLWLGRQVKASGMKGNPWGEWLSRFRTPTTSAPKKLADYQYYMQQKKYKLNITTLYERRKQDVPGTQLMNLRASIARELLALEPQVVRDEMRAGAEEEHAALLAKHEDALEGLPALDEEGLAEARSRFSSLIQPLLDGLAFHTGYDISILAGRVKKNEDNLKLNIECISLHAGVSSTSPPALDFSKAEPRVYADVMRNFSRFVWNANALVLIVIIDEFRLGNTTSTPDASTLATPEAGGPPTAAEEPRSSSSGDEARAAPQMPTTSPPAHVASSTTSPPANVVSSNATIPLTTDTLPHTPATIPSDTFSDADIRAHLGLDIQMPPDFDEFDFPEDLMPGLATNPLLLDGLAPAEPSLPVFAAPLGRELAMQLDTMVGEARVKRLAELRALDAAALERENNVVRNKYLLDNLGLGNAEKETLWGGSKPVVAPKRKAQGEGREQEGKRRRKRKDPVLESDGEEQDDEEEEIEEEDGAAVITSSGEGAKDAPPRPKPRPVPKKSTQAATTASAEILRTGQEFLKQPEYGERWDALLGVWWKREARVNFVGTSKSHPAKKRPREVGDWVGRARNHKPKIANAEVFGETWWAWWVDINPSWRGDKRPLNRDAEAGGGWDSVDLYGHNGFLNVLMALKWWRDAMSNASPDWEDAVDDVAWVLSAMESAILDGKQSSPPPNPPSPGIQPPTRTSGSPPGPNPEIPGNVLMRELQGKGGKERAEGEYELSQEELDEMEADLDANMSGDE